MVLDLVAQVARHEGHQRTGPEVGRALERDPDLYRFVLQRPVTAAAVQDYTTVVGMHVTRMIGDVLRAAGQDSGMAEPWGFAMVGAVRSAAERWLEQRTMSREALAGYLTDLLWAGGRSAYGYPARAVVPPTPTIAPAAPR